ncbi:MAG: 3-dehydroquinate synthase [Vicingus serpentipes]|nr:3-dehydroquinate synthase [Vicingus serpentipes]
MSKVQSIKTTHSEVFIGEHVFKVLTEYLTPYKDCKKFLLVDENTLQNCTTQLISQVKALENVEIIEIESGEENKTLDICYQIWKTLSDYKADRNSVLINLGGGVITDMGGFVASTYKRGIDFINIPTTLLSQIDASVGGKVGIDFDDLKNMIGVFNEPKGVFIYPPFLKTLDKRQMLSGYAEALKHALITDKKYWKNLKGGLLSNSEDWENLITTSVNIKNSIVLKDPKEKKERKLLNFGHTIGHAIESYSLKNDSLPLLHGEAIAIGMVCETYLSHLVLELSAANLKEISSSILSFYSRYRLDDNQFHQLIELMKHDKKNETSSINFTLLKEIGLAEVNHEVDVELIIESLNYYNSLIKK